MTNNEFENLYYIVIIIATVGAGIIGTTIFLLRYSETILKRVLKYKYIRADKFFSIMVIFVYILIFISTGAFLYESNTKTTEYQGIIKYRFRPNITGLIEESFIILLSVILFICYFNYKDSIIKNFKKIDKKEARLQPINVFIVGAFTLLILGSMITAYVFHRIDDQYKSIVISKSSLVAYKIFNLNNKKMGNIILPISLDRYVKNNVKNNVESNVESNVEIIIDKQIYKISNEDRTSFDDVKNFKKILIYLNENSKYSIYISNININTNNTILFEGSNKKRVLFNIDNIDNIDDSKEDIFEEIIEITINYVLICIDFGLVSALNDIADLKKVSIKLKNKKDEIICRILLRDNEFILVYYKSRFQFINANEINQINLLDDHKKYKKNYRIDVYLYRYVHEHVLIIRLNFKKILIRICSIKKI